MNVSWRQEEIVKQMCVEINGVVIANLGAKLRKGPPDDCLFNRGRSLLRMEGKLVGPRGSLRILALGAY